MPAELSDDPEVLSLWRESTKRQGNQYTCNHDNVMEAPKPQGNSKSYTVSRLKREAPELYQRVCDGKISANAAAIEVGKSGNRQQMGR